MNSALSCGDRVIVTQGAWEGYTGHVTGLEMTDRGLCYHLRIDPDYDVMMFRSEDLAPAGWQEVRQWVVTCTKCGRTEKTLSATEPDGLPDGWYVSEYRVRCGKC